jgi:glycosyltransferase involved in cell wall biosynthesis
VTGVLEVLPTLKRAGAERMAVSLALGLDRRSFEVSAVSLYGAFPGGFEPDLEAGGVRCAHLGKRRGFDPRMVPRLARVIAAVRPAIVHTHSYVLRYVLPAAMLSRTGARLVHTIHNVAERDADALGRPVNRLAFRRGAVPVAVGYEVAQSFRRVYGIAEAAVIPNGIDLRRFDCPRRPASRTLRMVSVARLEPQKDPLGLLEAFARVPGEPELAIVGEGSLRIAFMERARVLGVSHRVSVQASAPDVAPLLASADLSVLASRWEGRPLAVMEAMAAGLPMVATAVGGVPELVEHNVTGLLVPPGDPASLADALRMLAEDTELRRRMGDAGRERSARFGVEPMVAAYADLFARVAGERR